VDPGEVEKTIRSQIAKVAAEGLSASEVARARRQIEAEVIFDRDSTDQIAASLSEAIAVADWEWYADYPAAIGRVTEEDVRRVAAAHFTDDGLTVGHFSPRGAAA